MNLLEIEILSVCEIKINRLNIFNIIFIGKNFILNKNFIF